MVGSRAASYRKGAVYWVVSAKRPETRARRLTMLIEDSAAGRTVKPLTPREGSSSVAGQSPVSSQTLRHGER